jgi:hypothetical protein
VKPLVPIANNVLAIKANTTFTINVS